MRETEKSTVSHNVKHKKLWNWLNSEQLFWRLRAEASWNSGSRELRLLKSTFNAENFMCRFSWYIFSDFTFGIYFWNVRRSLKWQRITKILYFRSLRSFKVIDVDTLEKLVISAYYDKQHVCAYL